MARRYTRDNRGRFASGGGGATARGGRLRTAAGNKRATQTMRAQGAGGAGVIKGRAARTVAGQKVMGKLAKRPEPAKAAPKAAPQRIEGPMRTGGTRSRLSGRLMSEGAGKRGKAREERKAAMAGMRQMLGRVKPAQSAEPLSTGGTLRARVSLTRARAKAGTEGASSAQRGAATRANTYAKASVQRNTVRMKGGGMGGTIAKPAGLKPRPAKPAAPAKAKAAPRRVVAPVPEGAVKGRKGLMKSPEAAYKMRAANRIDRESEAILRNRPWDGNAGRNVTSASLRASAAQIESRAKSQLFNYIGVIAPRNRAMAQQRKLDAGGFAGQRVSFRSKKDAGANYRSFTNARAGGGRSIAQRRNSSGLRRTLTGTQPSLFGGSSGVFATKRTASNFDVQTGKRARRK